MTSTSAWEELLSEQQPEETTQLDYNLGASNNADPENADEGKAALRDRVKRQHNQEKRCKQKNWACFARFLWHSKMQLV